MGAAATPLGGAAPPDLALLPLVASGLGVDEVAPLESTIRQAVEAHYGPRLLPRKTLVERLERGGAKGLRCDRADPACSAQLGAIGGVERILVASLAVAPGRSMLSLRTIDVAEAAQLSFAQAPVSDAVSAEEVAAVLRALDLPEASTTALTVRGPASSIVVIDGADRGALPLPGPILDLPPGPHEVGLDGPVTFRQTVELRRGEPVAVDAPKPSAPASAATPRAPPPRDPPASSTPLYAMVGGGAAAVVGLATAAAGLAPLAAANLSAQRLAERELRAREDPTVLESEADAIRADHADLVAANTSWETWGWLAATLGGAVVVAGAAAAVAGAVLPAE